jgi:hypothetical protein
MILYRYLSHEFGIQALQTRKWKIGRLLELNDPLDCKPRFRYKGQDDITDIPPIFADLSKTMGIICYSTSIQDPVVWSHYAKVHTGIALGFEFSQHEMPAPVTYPADNQRSIVDLDDLVKVAGSDADQALWLGLQAGYLKKAHSWSYESEYRHFINLQACKMDGLHYFRDLPMERLRRVILGVHCPLNGFDIANAIPEWIGLDRASIFRAKINASSYLLDIFHPS